MKSEPSATGSRRWASATAAPPLLPPALTMVSQALGVAANKVLNVCEPEGLASLMDECGQCDWGSAEVSRIDAHINDGAFVQQVLKVFDDWLARGLVKKDAP